MYMKHNLTLVSAFIAGINQSPDKTVDKYLNYGRQLMKINIPKVLFIDATLIDSLASSVNEYNTLIPYKLTDMYLYQYRDKLKNVKVCSSNPPKDTIEYFMVQCHKTEWVKQAIELNKYDSQQYMWIDFGIYQFIDRLTGTPEDKFEKFSQAMYQIEYQQTPVVRMPGMWNMDSCCPDWYNYLKIHICWYFAGSLFGGHHTALVQLADLTRQQCLKMINTDSWLVWELNMWYLVYREHPQIFEQYKAKHDLSIFENYKNDLVFRIPLNQYDGLGNKMKAFIGSLSINKKTKIQTSLTVPYSNFKSILPAQYLFDELTDKNYLNYYTSRLLVLKREEPEQNNLLNEYSHHTFNIEGLNYLFSQNHIDSYYEADKLSTSLKKRILDTIHNLQFLPHIYEQVKQTQLFQGVTLAVTIRTWRASHEHDIHRPYDPMVYKNKVTEVLNRHPEIANLYVTIDNEQYLTDYESFLKDSHKRLYVYTRSPDKTDVENALIQVLVASKCQYVIGNRVSSFTELIWWYSDLKSQIYTV